MVKKVLKSEVVKMGRSFYRLLPARLRAFAVDFVYSYFGFIFSDVAHYRVWRSSQTSLSPELSFADLDIINIKSVAGVSTESPGSIGIHIHICQVDSISEMRRHLGLMPFRFSLYVSVADLSLRETCLKAFSDLSNIDELAIEFVVNRGRDIAPLFCQFGVRLLKHDFIGHFHTKNLLRGWREYLLEALIGGVEDIRKIFHLFRDQRVGIVYPQSFSLVPYTAGTWLANRVEGVKLCERLGIRTPSGYFHYPGGSMFWARTQSLQPLFHLGLQPGDFHEESDPAEGSLADCLERLFFLVAQKQGYSGVVLTDDKDPGHWSLWNFDQYVARPAAELDKQIEDRAIQAVIFDISDTLLLQPFMHPDFVRTFGMHQRALAQPRHDLIRAFNKALSLDKRVILIGDCSLPKGAIEKMLEEAGIRRWNSLYLSEGGELGRYTGDVYRRILKEENLEPGDCLMIGDDEFSDFHLPSALGMKAFHILRPAELSRGWPRLSVVMEHAFQSDLVNDQVTGGLLANANFQTLGLDPGSVGHIPVSNDVSHIGYSVVGPLIVHFAAWLYDEARASGIKKLWFLSREGQVIKRVYDKLYGRDAQSPESRYMVVSRRSVGVPSIRSFSDVLNIAKSSYHSGGGSAFLRERFGISLTTARIGELRDQGVWVEDSRFVIQNEDVHPIEPLLKELWPEIEAQKDAELPCLLRYLSEFGDVKDVGVVDIGYAGTIQAALNVILDKPVHGFYLATNSKSLMVRDRFQVRVAGCFGEGIVDGLSCKVLANSFELEKLLSSDEAQVVNYHAGIPNYKELRSGELATRPWRAKLQSGIDQYVDDIVRLRKTIAPTLRPECEMVTEIFGLFASRQYLSESRTLRQVLLDDDYCGRGLV
ncbi:MAG: hypothetical protein KF799_06160 [Bdellovibrionales bacterium]|nr:hypothetical protein [Bdellovibrionales bacterium]